MNIIVQKKIFFAALLLILAGITFVVLGATRKPSVLNESPVSNSCPMPTVKKVECVIVSPYPTATPEATLVPTRRIIRNSPTPSPEPTI